jgi:hypothetical protein
LLIAMGSAAEIFFVERSVRGGRGDWITCGKRIRQCVVQPIVQPLLRNEAVLLLRSTRFQRSDRPSTFHVILAIAFSRRCNRHAQRVGNLFFRGALPPGGVHVRGDAVITGAFDPSFPVEHQLVPSRVRVAMCDRISRLATNRFGAARP